MTKSYEAILLAAGSGTRLGDKQNKVLLTLDDSKRPIIDYAFRKFLEDEWCTHIIIVIRNQDRSMLELMFQEQYGHMPEKVTLVEGGAERQYSVKNGLNALHQKNSGYILVHDAARPFIQKELLHTLVNSAYENKAAIVAIPAKDTVKRVREQTVTETLYRPEIWQVQTPQAFSTALLLKAYQKAEKDNYLGNEEGELVERIGHTVKVVVGNSLNFKITTPEDLKIAKGLLLANREEVE